MLFPWRWTRRAAAFAAVCVVGLRIGIPGIRREWLERGIWDTNNSALLRLFDMITGHGVAQGSILALSITPFLTVRLYMWLAKKVFPRIAAMDENAAGQAQLKRWTRALNLGVALVQSYGYAKFLQTIPNAVVNPGTQFILGTMACVTGGAVVLMHLSERITATDDEPANSHDITAQQQSVSSTNTQAALKSAQPADAVVLSLVRDQIKTK